MIGSRDQHEREIFIWICLAYPDLREEPSAQVFFFVVIFDLFFFHHGSPRTVVFGWIFERWICIYASKAKRRINIKEMVIYYQPSCGVCYFIFVSCFFYVATCVPPRVMVASCLHTHTPAWMVSTQCSMLRALRRFGFIHKFRLYMYVGFGRCSEVYWEMDGAMCLINFMQIKLSHVRVCSKGVFLCPSVYISS